MLLSHFSGIRNHTQCADLGEEVEVIASNHATDGPKIEFPPKQRKLGWGTLRMIAWATRLTQLLLDISSYFAP